MLAKPNNSLMPCCLARLRSCPHVLPSLSFNCPLLPPLPMFSVPGWTVTSSGPQAGWPRSNPTSASAASATGLSSTSSARISTDPSSLTSSRTLASVMTPSTMTKRTTMTWSPYSPSWQVRLGFMRARKRWGNLLLFWESCYWPNLSIGST